MNLKITKIHDIGDGQERLVLEAAADTDLGFYILFRTRLVGSGVSNRLEESFWFPDKIIKAGDKAVIYTGRGAESANTSGGATTYFYYWNLEKSLWNDNDSVPLLVSLEGWDYYDFHKREVFIKKGSARQSSTE
jgi:hypothetical protein